MQNSEDDPTSNREWLAEQVDRLLGFEILHRSIHATYQPLEATALSDKTGIDRNAAKRIINNLRKTLHDHRR
jgi:hypothetical protein